MNDNIDPDMWFGAMIEEADHVASGVTDGTLEQTTRRLDLAMVLRAKLDEIIDQLSTTVAERMETDQMTLTGVGKIERRPRTSSTWIDESSRERQHEDAVRAIVGLIATDPMTGEVHPPVANAVRRTFDLVKDAFSLGADPKVPFRKVLGLQPDYYRAKRVTGWTVKIEEETL